MPFLPNVANDYICKFLMVTNDYFRMGDPLEQAFILLEQAFT